MATVQTAKWGGSYIAVQTDLPGRGSSFWGVGQTRSEAVEAMQATPIECHRGVEDVLAWALTEDERTDVGEFSEWTED